MYTATDRTKFKTASFKNSGNHLTFRISESDRIVPGQMVWNNSLTILSVGLKLLKQASSYNVLIVNGTLIEIKRLLQHEQKFVDRNSGRTATAIHLL